MNHVNDRQRTYWRKNLTLTAILLGVWFLVSFVASWYARELNEIEFIGPLGYYMGAQGTLIIYVVIIWFYARTMNRLDDDYGIDGDEP
jgi:putative solute:sodium symporter small subunit